MADLTITEAAARLGISKETLRTRVKRGKVAAHKGADGQWRITIPDEAATPPHRPEPVREPGHEPDVEPDGEHVVIPAAGRMQLDALRDEWLLPLITQIGALERENGALEERVRQAEERAAHAEHERDALRNLRTAWVPVDTSYAPRINEEAEMVTPKAHAPQRVAERVQRGLWRRLADALRGGPA